MSADNGIYIGVFPNTIRVIHAQAIEDCDDVDWLPTEVTDAYCVSYYGKSAHFNSMQYAMTEAEKLEDKYEWTEYGLCTIKYERPLPDYSRDEASKIIEDFWSKYERSHGD